MDKYTIACANYWGGGDYYDPANPDKVRATVDENIGLARDHIAVCGGHGLPRPGEGTITENMDFRKKYIVETLHGSLRN